MSGHERPRAGSALDDSRLRAKLSRVPGLTSVDVEPSVDSTNLELRRRAEAGRAAPIAVLLADRQTEGRGRRGRFWWSPDGGGLYLSVLLAPRGPSDLLARWSLTVAVAVAEATGPSIDRPIELKWPNDVMVDGRKLAGILVDVWGAPTGALRMVIGVGVNVAPASEPAPAELVDRLTSLADHGGAMMDRETLAAAVVSQIVDLGTRLDDGDWPAIERRWSSLAVGATGLRVRTSRGVGVTEGVDRHGAMRVRLEADGTTVVVHSVESLVPVAERGR